MEEVIYPTGVESGHPGASRPARAGRRRQPEDRPTWTPARTRDRAPGDLPPGETEVIEDVYED